MKKEIPFIKRILQYSRIFSLTLVLITLTSIANGQIDNYNFTQGTFTLKNYGNFSLPWAEISSITATLGSQQTQTQDSLTNGNPLKVIYTGDTPIGSTASSDTGLGYPIGFNFVYHGESFDRVAISGNGYIKLGHSGQSIVLKNDSTAGAIFDGNIIHQNIISAFQTNASILNGYISNQSSASVLIGNVGLPGNRIFIAQYNCIIFLNGGANVVNLPFQIQLFENNDSIRIVYQTLYDYGTLSTSGAVGITDGNGNYNNRSVINGVNTWTTSTSGTSATDLCDFTYLFGPQGSNTQNLVYTWMPPVFTATAPTCPEAYFFVDQYYHGGIGYGGDGNFYSPIDNNINVTTNPIIYWSDESLSSHQVTTYDVYLDTDNPPNIEVASNLTTTSFTPPMLAPNTKYYLNIVSKNASGKDSSCVGSFITNSARQYCNTLPEGDGFTSSFSINTLSYVATTANALTYDFPDTVPYITTLKRDTSYTFSAMLASPNPINPWGNAQLRVFIDFNQDGDFDDPGEAIVGGSGGPNAPLTFSIPIPDTAKLGQTIMRVCSKNSADIDPFGSGSCGSYTEGGSQNFIITITPSTNCQSFNLNPIINNVACYDQSNGDINLNLSGGITPYNIVWADGSSTDIVRNNLSKGIYQATIIDANNCEVATPLIALIQPSTLVIDTSTSNKITYVFGSGGTSPYTFLWNNGDTSSNTSNFVAGTYSITVTDSHGCDTTLQNIIVESNSVSPPPPVDSVSDSSTNIIVYPNPTSRIIYLKSQKLQKIQVEVLNEQGRLMQDGDYNVGPNNTASIDMALYAGGIYFLKVIDNNSTNIVKVIKE